ncbi:MAG: cellulose binding domain-containing protein [Acidothermus sp.]|nr:cellulose binding domain-containing protein [Acidothermus sp.]MCL6537197.1 cellulose binding domain-containing protein [Acidothermus sp.]
MVALPIRRWQALIVGIAVGTTVAAGVLALGGPAYGATTTTCSPTSVTSVAGDEYRVQANEWNSSAQQCLTIDTTTGAWSVSTANFNLPTNGAPATYPAIYKGCHWGNCTTVNVGMPIQVSKIGSATTSWSTTQVSSGAYDVAYDVWTNTTPTTSGQPNGTEVMIWLNSRGGVQPFGSQTATGVNVAGHTWNVWQGQQTSWKIISYVLTPGATSISNLDLKAIMLDAAARGSLNTSDYLIDVEAGFEIWQGGQGLASNSFSVSVSAGSSTSSPTPSPTPTQSSSPSPTPSPTSTSSSGAGCKATYSVSNDWGTGFTANVTVANTGSKATSGWTVSWSFGGNQVVTNYWSTALTQSGKSVTARNVDYNGVIQPGQSTTFGFNANYSGSNSVPTLTCTAS